MGQFVRHRIGDGVRGVTALIFLASSALAGEAVVQDVTVERLSPGRFRVSATIRHGDEGWAHYADRWVLLDPTGRQLAERVLTHPHVREQPFTRSTVATIGSSVKRVRVRARDSLHGEGTESSWVLVPH